MDGDWKIIKGLGAGMDCLYGTMEDFRILNFEYLLSILGMTAEMSILQMQPLAVLRANGYQAASTLKRPTISHIHHYELTSALHVASCGIYIGNQIRQLTSSSL